MKYDKVEIKTCPNCDSGDHITYSLKTKKYLCNKCNQEFN